MSITVWMLFTTLNVKPLETLARNTLFEYFTALVTFSYWFKSLTFIDVGQSQK